LQSLAAFHLSNSILDRYARLQDRRIIIDVTASRVEDLYNNFDHSAPYIKKDLSSALADYLVESAIEIGPEAFVISFRLQTPADPEVQTRVRDSVRQYFIYMQQLQKNKLARMLRNATIYLLAGLVILLLSFFFNEREPITDSALVHVFAEGLTIAAWVSLWEALATLLIDWAPLKNRLNIYRRIANSEVLFV
jgi:hypothetical protein